MSEAIAGRLIGIARRSGRYTPMEQVDAIDVLRGAGLEGDHKGPKFPNRGVTILSREAWEEALAELKDLADPVPLPWTARRANLLVEGLRLPQARGAVLEVGPLRLEVTAQTFPCGRMEAVHKGLMKALAADWRGGICCRVIAGGRIRLGELVTALSGPAAGAAVHGLRARKAIMTFRAV